MASVHRWIVRVPVQMAQKAGLTAQDHPPEIGGLLDHSVPRMGVDHEPPSGHQLGVQLSGRPPGVPGEQPQRDDTGEILWRPVKVDHPKRPQEGAQAFDALRRTEGQTDYRILRHRPACVEVSGGGKAILRLRDRSSAPDQAGSVQDEAQGAVLVVFQH